MASQQNPPPQKAGFFTNCTNSISKCCKGCWAGTEKCFAGIKKKLEPTHTKVVKFLEPRGEIVYIYSAVPAFFFFILSMVTSAVYVYNKPQWAICETLQELQGKSERTDGYVLGILILQYSFIVAYANMIMELYKPLATIGVSFLYFVCFIIASLVWTIIGTVIVSNSECTDTTVHKLAVANIIIMYILLGSMFIYSIVIFFLSKRSTKTIPADYKTNTLTNTNEPAKNPNPVDDGTPKPLISDSELKPLNNDTNPSANN